jgi:ATP-dependent DNA helicase RecG
MALSIYKSLQPHFLETLPGRKPVKTTINYFENLDSQIITKIREKLDLNQKIYVVCTKIDADSGDSAEDIWSTTATAKKLESIFPEKILEVHGKKAEKKEILDEYKNSKEKMILVTTTVVEVGVDVSEATLMIILNSERYGLAALHQLRGRVGRNNYENNECVLITWQKYGKPKRLGILESCNDGFEIAQKDLELRGGGDLYGKIQSGFDDEIEELMGLDPQKYEQLTDLVKSIDFDNLKSNSLERLENYVKKQSEEIWEE